MSVTVPAPALVKPPAPLMTPLIVSVVPALLTVTVRGAANVRGRLTAFVPVILLSAKPPAPSVRALPPRVYPLPEMVMELKLAPLKVLLFERRAAPLGKTRSSPPVPVGATPPDQLLPLVHLLFPAPPLQVNVCAAPRGASVSRASHTRRAATRPLCTHREARQNPDSRKKAGSTGVGWRVGEAAAGRLPKKSTPSLAVGYGQTVAPLTRP